MDVHERMLNLAGRDALFRPIEFERYRKPHVVEYPRHAVVLNPQHTRQQQQQNAKLGGSSAAGLNGQENSDDSDDTDDDEKRKRRGSRGDDEDEDDDDPRFMDKAEFLCSDHALEKVLHHRWKQVGPVGVGLVNLGNTCFANSVIQAIAYTPALAQFFGDTFRAADNQLGAPYDFAFALGETVRHVHLGKSGGRGGSAGAYRPALIMGHLRALSPHFSLGRQSDAHEFAVQLLLGCQKSILHRLVGSKKLPLRVTYTSSLFRICGGYLRSQVSWSRQDEIQQLLKEGKRQGAMDLKIEQKNKQQQQQQAGRRSMYNPDRMNSNTYDPTNIIHAELAGQTLAHCLAKFCAPEKLHGRCYRTPRDVAVIATKQLRIHIPPSVLIIHLKRFTPSGGKISKFVEYPPTLDLFPYCTASEGESASSSSSSGDADSDSRRQDYLYELNAVCVHEGGSINYGHYYSIVKARNGAWYECNDATVRPLSQDRAMSKQAYMLFYSKVPVERARKPRQGAARLGAASLKNGSFRGPQAAPRGAAEDAVGEELTEEQVAALLAARKARDQSNSAEAAATVTAGTRVDGSTANDGDESSDGDMEHPAHLRRDRNRGKNKYRADGVSPAALKRQRDDLSTDEDEDATPPPFMNGTSSATTTANSATGASQSRTALPSINGDAQKSKGGGLSRYGSVIKAMRVNPRTPLQRAMQARGQQNGTLENEELAQRETKALGRAAVRALAEEKERAMPETVKRDTHAPKFQQRIRDAMWEMEMDKGRVKKVRKSDRDRAAPVDGDGRAVNRFQERSKGRFDNRGRRLQRDDEDS